MLDQNQFLETLRGVSEIVRTAPEPMSEEEILAYFKDMELSEEQRSMILGYMQLPAEMRGANPEMDMNEEETSDDEEPVDSSKQEADMPEETVSIESLSDSSFYRMYVDEVKQLQVSDDDGLKQLYHSLLKGDDSVIGSIVDSWLMRVMEIAGYYKDTDVLMEDVIQEGNMGLWMALSDVPEDITAASMSLYLTGCIQQSMENYIREMTGDLDQIQALLGKEALLLEAEKYLLQENNREPSLRELCEYTHMTREEIESLLTIREEKKEQA